MLRVKQLKKQYKQGFVLQAQDFSIGKGELVAFLGANGSGKSTLFELLTGNSDASSGEIYLLDERMSPEMYLLKRKIGYLPQNIPLPKWVTGEELLVYSALLHNLEHARDKVQNSMQFWDCAEYSKKPLASCSFGMQKRIGLALATLHNPPCLILDEPFSGLDLYHIHALEEALRKRKQEGKTTLLSTHILPYVVGSCERVFILEGGQLNEIKTWSQQNADEKTAGIEQHFFQRSGTYGIRNPANR